QPLTSLGRDEFDDALFALVVWFYVMVPEFNAAILALDANDVRGSSATSFTPNAAGLGLKTFAVPSGKSWLPAMWVTGGYTSDGREYWAGVVKSYAGTSLEVDVKLVSNHGTARSSWQISMSPPITDLLEDNSVIVHSGNGYGSTNVKIRRFTTVEENLGSSITYADSATDGASFTINQDGVYALYYQDKGQDTHAITRNANGTINPIINNASQNLAASSTTGTSVKSISRVAKLNAGDVVRAHTNGVSIETDASVLFSIRRLS
ncbi:hypothetical protein, partial [Nitrosomonas sp.]|uniref:hypothetical protein n=1 Tax=Nitrosomonas sp. TaxID=42353 RepID=UPI001D8BF270